MLSKVGRISTYIGIKFCRAGKWGKAILPRLQIIIPYYTLVVCRAKIRPVEFVPWLRSRTIVFASRSMGFCLEEVSFVWPKK